MAIEGNILYFFRCFFEIFRVEIIQYQEFPIKNTFTKIEKGVKEEGMKERKKEKRRKVMREDGKKERKIKQVSKCGKMLVTVEPV